MSYMNEEVNKTIAPDPILSFRSPCKIGEYLVRNLQGYIGVTQSFVKYARNFDVGTDC